MAIGKKTGGGSRKGIPNKTTKELKDMIQGALDAKGGQAWLEQQMDESPAAFMTLLGKILPKDVNVGGQKDNPVVSTIKLVAMKGDERS
jgi:hypothetical protein